MLLTTSACLGHLLNCMLTHSVSHKVIAPLAALLLVAANLVTALHHGDGAHVVCAEHGQWEHAGEHGDDSNASNNTSELQRSRADAPTLHANAGEAGHADGCALPKCLRQDDNAIAPALEFGLVEHSSYSLSIFIERSVTATLLRLAPKTSPPHSVG